MKVKVVNLKGIKRVIYGEMVNQIDVDYTQSLTALKSDLDHVVPILIESLKDKNWFAFMQNKTIKNHAKIHQGSSHLDIVDDGIGSLNWLRVEDHKV